MRSRWREAVRLDKWLWAARFYKTRTLASRRDRPGRVEVNGAAAKPSRELHVGDRLTCSRRLSRSELVIVAARRTARPRPVARALYEETAESIAARERALQQRRLAPEPALSTEQGRPTKRDRRAAGRLAALERQRRRLKPA